MRGSLDLAANKQTPSASGAHDDSESRSFPGWSWAAVALALAAAGATATALVSADIGPGLMTVVGFVLALVFGAAAAAKLRNPSAFSKAIAGFGVPAVVATPLAILVPLAELGVAAALLMPATASEGALGALALLLVFSVAVGVALARGRDADCNCFGQIHARSLSARMLLRNGVLAGLAAALAWPGSADPAAPWGGDFSLLAITGAAGLALLVTIGMIARRGASEETTETPSALGAGAASLNRRGAIRLAGGAALATWAASVLGSLDPSPAAAALDDDCPPGQYCCLKPLYLCWTCCGVKTGFVGGGTVQTASGQAQASFLGTTLNARQRDEQIFGTLVWFDPAWQGGGLRLQSSRITSFGRVSGSKARELRGLVSANGRGSHAFQLRVLDAGAPGSGSDTVSLRVTGVAAGGAGAGGRDYVAEGRLVGGNVTDGLQSRERTRSHGVRRRPRRR